MRQTTHIPGPQAAFAKPELSLTELWLILRKRRILIIGIVVAAVLAAVVFNLVKGKEYTSTGEIKVQPDAQSSLKLSMSAGLGFGNNIDLVLESDIRILQSESLLLKVAQKTHLIDKPAFFGGVNASRVSLAMLHGNLQDPAVRGAVIKIMRKHLTITRVPRTQMVTISYRSSDPVLSTDIVNTLTAEFIENNFITHYASTQHVSEWLSSQIDDLRNSVQKSQDRMVDLQKSLGISALDPTHSMVLEEIESLEKGVADASSARVLAEAHYHILQSLPPDQILDMPSNGETTQSDVRYLLNSLRSQRATINSELARLQPIYGPNYPQVKQLVAQQQTLDKEISKQEGRIVAQARDAFSVAQMAENRAKGALDARVNQLYGQRDNLVQYALVSQEYEGNRKMYESILSRLREAAVDAGLDSADVSLVDMASVPIKPSSTSLSSSIALGLFFGFVISLVLAFILERADTRMRDARQIQELLGVPSLAVVPQTDWRNRDSDPAAKDRIGPEILWDSRSAFAEAVRVLRTSIQLSSTSRQSRVIALSSCQPGEGKSTLSTNLAAALAQGGKKTILIDTDMRRPSLLWRLKLTGMRGLSEFLTGNATAEEIIQQHRSLPNLDLVSSGSTPPLPADLLSSDTMRNFVDSLREKYEYVLFDTPPVLSVTDPLIVSSLADGLVLVTRQGVCTRPMLQRVFEVVSDVNLKLYGFVLNGVDASLPEYYGYLGYYSYDYKNQED